LDGVRILVVDDDIRHTDAMTALLERVHADVRVAESDADAIGALALTPGIDIVVVPILMPVMDGYDTIRAIREIDRFKSLPIVAVTRRPTAGERQRCLDAGANDYVPEPVDTVELHAALRPWLPPLPDAAGSLIALSESVAKPARTALDRRPRVALEGNGFGGSRILVVDDDFRNIYAMTALLERGHAEVIVAESGADAIDILGRTPGIDIVLMDIMMPVMDGYDTIRAIRAIDRFKTLPVIAVSGKSGAGERQRCLDAGANDYVTKPVDTAALIEAIRPWLPTTPAQPAA
jgi:CheY-like chemotaxis protein